MRRKLVLMTSCLFVLLATVTGQGDETQVTHITGTYVLPKMIASGLDFAIIWPDERDGVAPEIYFTKVDEMGNRLVPDTRVTTDGVTTCYDPCMVWTGTEYGLVWYKVPSGETGNVYFTRLDANGVRQIEPIVVAPTSLTAGYMAAPCLVFNGSGYGLAYFDFVAPQTAQVFFRHLDSEGIPQGNPVQVTTAAVPYAQLDDLEMVWDGAGYAIIWEDSRHQTNSSDPPDIYFARLLPDGTKIVDDTRVTNGYSGLKIVDISDPQNPSVVGGCDTPGWPHGLHAGDGFVYMAESNGRFQVIDVGNPSAPYIAANTGAKGVRKGIFVSGNYAYVAASSSGLEIFDIGDPQDPFHVGTCDTDSAWRVFVSGGYAYVANLMEGLVVIDISDPQNPFVVTRFDVYAKDIFVSGDYAYVTSTTGLEVINITDPHNPTAAGTCTLPSIWQRGVFVSGDFAYVTSSEPGSLQVIDIQNPQNPFVVGSCDLSHTDSGIFVSGSHAYVAGGSAGLLVIDISNPQNPSLISSCEGVRGAYVSVSGDYAYVSANNINWTYPGLVWNGNDYALYWVYYDSSGERELYFTRVSQTGQRLLGDMQITENQPEYYAVRPSMTWNGSEYAIAWLQDVGLERGQMYYVRLDENGVKKTARIRVSTTADGTSGTPSIAWNGNLYGIVWDGVGTRSIYYNQGAPNPVPIIDKIKRRRCDPGQKIRIFGTGFGDVQGDSVVHMNLKTFDSTSPKIKLWSDTLIKVKIPFMGKDCSWFKHGDGTYTKKKVWVTVDGVDSNTKRIKVMKPDTCP